MRTKLTTQTKAGLLTIDRIELEARAFEIKYTKEASSLPIELFRETFKSNRKVNI